VVAAERAGLDGTEVAIGAPDRGEPDARRHGATELASRDGAQTIRPSHRGLLFPEPSFMSSGSC
jgi:hypothetical protein